MMKKKSDIIFWIVSILMAAAVIGCILTDIFIRPESDWPFPAAFIIICIWQILNGRRIIKKRKRSADYIPDPSGEVLEVLIGIPF